MTIFTTNIAVTNFDRHMVVAGYSCKFSSNCIVTRLHTVVHGMARAQFSASCCIGHQLNVHLHPDINT